MESNQAEQKRKKTILQNKNRLRELSDSIKHNNIHIIGASEKEEREKGAENLFQENFPNLGQEIDTPDPEGTENSHQNQQKQANTKTYCN